MHTFTRRKESALRDFDRLKIICPKLNRASSQKIAIRSLIDSTNANFTFRNRIPSSNPRAAFPAGYESIVVRVAIAMLWWTRPTNNIERGLVLP